MIFTHKRSQLSESEKLFNWWAKIVTAWTNLGVELGNVTLYQTEDKATSPLTQAVVENMFLMGNVALLGQSKIDLLLLHELFSYVNEKSYFFSSILSAVSEYARISPMLRAFHIVC